MKTRVVLLLLLCGSIQLLAPIGIPYSYQDLKEKATLIVIATASKTSVLKESAEIPGSNVLAKELETTFEVMTVLKGELATNKLVLHHWHTELKRSGPTVYSSYDPNLVSFEPANKKHYLMFLQSESDGRFAAASGQYHASNSFRILASAVSPLIGSN